MGKGINIMTCISRLKNVIMQPIKRGLALIPSEGRISVQMSIDRASLDGEDRATEVKIGKLFKKVMKEFYEHGEYTFEGDEGAEIINFSFMVKSDNNLEQMLFE